MFELTPYERRHQRALFNPFRDMENFEKNFWGDMSATDFKTDIKDNGKEYVLEAELPGFKKEDIHVDIEDGYMTISAERSNRRECPPGFCVFICAFYKSYFIPCFFI